MRRLLLLLAVVAVAHTLRSPTAEAHAELRDAEPKPNGTASAGTEEISLQLITFQPEEGVTVEVVGPDGDDVTVGEPQVTALDGTVVVAVEPLQPGRHTVRWSARSSDGDGQSTGSYVFDVEEGPGGGAGVVALWVVAFGIPAAVFVRSWLKKRSTRPGTRARKR